MSEHNPPKGYTVAANRARALVSLRPFLKRGGIVLIAIGIVLVAVAVVIP